MVKIIVYKGDIIDMPEPPEIAVDGVLQGKDITAEKMEEMLAELIPE